MAIDHFCSDNVDQYSVELSAQSIVGQFVFFCPNFCLAQNILSSKLWWHGLNKIVPSTNFSS